MTYDMSSTPGLAYRHNRRVHSNFIFAFPIGTHKLGIATKLCHSTTMIGKTLLIRQDISKAKAIRN
jgi:hypothetical protein